MISRVTSLKSQTMQINNHHIPQQCVCKRNNTQNNEVSFNNGSFGYQYKVRISYRLHVTFYPYPLHFSLHFIFTERFPLPYNISSGAKICNLLQPLHFVGTYAILTYNIWWNSEFFNLNMILHLQYPKKLSIVSYFHFLYTKTESFYII